jgi:hypothetical protein
MARNFLHRRDEFHAGAKLDSFARNLVRIACVPRKRRGRRALPHANHTQAERLVKRVTTQQEIDPSDYREDGMRNRFATRLKLGLIAGTATALLAGLAGCSSMQGVPATMKTPKGIVQVPLVQNCWPYGVSSPTHYICPDGKVYTSFKLTRLREEAMAQYAAGK